MCHKEFCHTLENLSFFSFHISHSFGFFSILSVALCDEGHISRGQVGSIESDRGLLVDPSDIYIYTIIYSYIYNYIYNYIYI